MGRKGRGSRGGTRIDFKGGKTNLALIGTIRGGEALKRKGARMSEKSSSYQIRKKRKEG